MSFVSVSSLSGNPVGEMNMYLLYLWFQMAALAFLNPSSELRKSVAVTRMSSPFLSETILFAMLSILANILALLLLAEIRASWDRDRLARSSAMDEMDARTSILEMTSFDGIIPSVVSSISNAPSSLPSLSNRIVSMKSIMCQCSGDFLGGISLGKPL